MSVETTKRQLDVVDISFDETRQVIRTNVRQFKSLDDAKNAIEKAYPECEVDIYPLAWQHCRYCLEWLGVTKYGQKRRFAVVWKDDCCRDIFRRYMMGLHADMNRELNPRTAHEDHDFDSDQADMCLESARALALCAHAVMVATDE